MNMNKYVSFKFYNYQVCYTFERKCHLKSDSLHHHKHLISTAECRAGDQSFSSILDQCQQQLKSKSLRMVAGNQSNPVLTLNTLPSGGYQAVKHRIQLRSNCFRSQANKFLNSIFHWNHKYIIFYFPYTIVLLYT